MSTAAKQKGMQKVQTAIPSLNAGDVVNQPLDSSKHWASLDSPAKVILESLLHPVPEQRMTASQVLSEPWLYEAQGLPYPHDSIPEAPTRQAEQAVCPYAPGSSALKVPIASSLHTLSLEYSMYGSEVDPSSEYEFSSDAGSQDMLPTEALDGQAEQAACHYPPGFKMPADSSSSEDMKANDTRHSLSAESSILGSDTDPSSEQELTSDDKSSRSEELLPTGEDAADPVGRSPTLVQAPDVLLAMLERWCKTKAATSLLEAVPNQDAPPLADMRNTEVGVAAGLVQQAASLLISLDSTLSWKHRSCSKGLQACAAFLSCHATGTGTTPALTCCCSTACR